MATEGCNEIMLFGTRIVVDSMRKIASLNNLSDYQHVADAGKEAKANGYVSDNVGRVGAIRERKRGTPWSEEEHKRFLMGLKKVGKGDWRGISKNFVKTRTPTQVASHAQKYFLRHKTVKSRRRSSLFDITTETVTGKSVEENSESGNEDSGSSRPHSQTKGSSNTCPHPMIPAIPTQMPAVLLAPVTVAYPLASSIPSQVTEQPMTIHLPPPTPLQLFPSPSAISVPNYTPSLNLSLSLPTNSHVSQNPALQTMPRFTSKDRFISVV